MIWAIYRVDTGLFTGKHVTCNPRLIERNTPDGCAVIEGRFDHLSQRVDLATGEVVDYQPPSPGDDYQWDDATRRHVKRPEVVEREREVAAAVSSIDSAEKRQARAVREALLELLPEESKARERLLAIEAEVATEREKL